MDNLIADVCSAIILNCKVRRLAPKTVSSYSETLSHFVAWCGPILISELIPSKLRENILELQQRPTAGGVHLVYRYVRPLLLWWDIETDGDFRSSVHKVSPPKVPREKLDPVTPDLVNVGRQRQGYYPHTGR